MSDVWLGDRGRAGEYWKREKIFALSKLICHNEQMYEKLAKGGSANGDETDEGYDVMRFLTAIVYPGKNGSRLDVVKDYIEFSHNPELRAAARGIWAVI